MSVFGGGLILWWEPFGRPPSSGAISPVLLLNALLLALAPALALLLAFRRARSHALERYGLAIDPVLGGAAALPASLAATAVLPAALLARGDILAGAGVAVVLFGSWWILLAVQARVRAVARAGVPTSAEIDALQVHVEAAPIAALWIAGLAAAAVTGQPAGFCLQASIVVGITAVALAFLPVILRPRWAGLVAAAVWLTAVAVVAWLPAVGSFVGAIAATVMAARFVERQRRAKLSEVIAAFEVDGRQNALIARYGTDYGRLPGVSLGRCSDRVLRGAGMA